MVNIEALEAAIGRVERIRDQEFSFEVEDMKICLRPLRPDEETEVQRYAQIAMEQVPEGEADNAAFSDFMDRMRHASLAFAIVQIGSLDLRDVEFVETGEKNEQGKPISVPKWEAVRDLMARDWSRLMLSQVFAKFGEMLDRLELRAQEAVHFEPVDLEEEIERTERRLRDLKETRSRIKAPVQESLHKAQTLAAERDRFDAETRNQIRSGEILTKPTTSEAQDAVDSITEEEAESEAPIPPPQEPQEPQEPPGRRSAIPTSAPAPERDAAPEASQEPSEAGNQESQATQGSEEAPELDQHGIPLPHDGDSFFDPTDPDEAMATESRRQAILHQRHLAKQRAQKLQQQMREEMGMPSEDEMAAERLREDRAAKSPKGVRLDNQTAGLRAAANVSDAVFDSGAGSVRTGRPNQPQPQPGAGGKPAHLHGKPVYKMPTQTLDRPERERERQHGEPPPSPVKVNNPSVGGRQTKFRGPDQQ